MQRSLWLTLLALPLVAASVEAQCCLPQSCPPVKLDGALVLNFNCVAGGGRTQLGPWYQYWPYEAHFNLPAPMGPYAGGPSFMTLPPQMLGGMAGQQMQSPQQQQWNPPAPAPLPPGQKQPNGTAPLQQPAPPQQSVFQPVGYYYASPVPAYWYGR